MEATSFSHLSQIFKKHLEKKVTFTVIIFDKLGIAHRLDRQQIRHYGILRTRFSFCWSHGYHLCKYSLNKYKIEIFNSLCQKLGQTFSFYHTTTFA